MQFEEEQIVLKQTDVVCKKPVSGESEAQTPQLGDRYDVLSLLGKGGMASVYKVYDKILEKTFAAKVISPELAHERVALKRFADEAEAASSMTHGNIAAVYSHGVTSDNAPFLCMDYLEGETLENVLRREGKLELERVVNIFQQICEALIHAHMKGVVHRDLKPSNIFITKNADDVEVVKLVDFGIAKLQYREQDSTRLTQTGALVGCPLYMSPEQCRADQQDARSDIYSLGCVMYHAIAGRPPFSGANSVKVILQHVKQAPTAFEHENGGSETEKALQTCILRCLEKNPADRFQSTDELLVQLQSLEYKGPNIAITVEAQPAPIRRFLAVIIDAMVLVTLAHVIGHTFLGGTYQPPEKLIHFPAWQIDSLRAYAYAITPTLSFSVPFLVISSLLMPVILLSIVFLALSLPFVATRGATILMPVFPLIYLAYCAILESSPLQATLGKKLLGLTVVNARGERITFLRAVLRFLSKWISPFVIARELGIRPIRREHALAARNVLSTYWELCKYYPTDSTVGAYVVRKQPGRLNIDRDKYLVSVPLTTLQLMRKRWMNSLYSIGFTALACLVMLYLFAPSSFWWTSVGFASLACMPYITLWRRLACKTKSKK